jgi:hypothetical protein
MLFDLPRRGCKLRQSAEHGKVTHVVGFGLSGSLEVSSYSLRTFSRSFACLTSLMRWQYSQTLPHSLAE